MTEHITPAPKPAYSAVIKQEGAWWIGWMEEIPGVNCQEETREELFVSQHVALVDLLAFDGIEQPFTLGERV